MILLDIWSAWNNAATLAREKDEAIKDAAEWQAKHIETRRALESAHKQLADKQTLIDLAHVANVELEARLAANDPTLDTVRAQRWRAWSERQNEALHAECDLLGRRILALEAWVQRNGGERDVIYGEAGLPLIADPNPRPVAAPPEEAA